MKENSNSFIFYKSFYEAISKLPPENQLEVYNAICQYSLDGIEPDNLSGIASAIFILIKPNIDSSQKKYQASVENGKRGGRPRNNEDKETQTEPNNNPTKTQNEPSQNLDKDVDKDYDKDVDVDVDKDIAEDLNYYTGETEKEKTQQLLQQRFVECTSSTNLYAISECLSFLEDLPFDVIEMALVKTSEKNGRLEVC